MISRLVVLAQVLEERDRLVARHHLALDLQVALGELRHVLFDGRKIFRRERALVGEIVVEAVLDHRADGDLRIREQLLHRLRQQMRRRMADDFQAFGILVGDDRQIASCSMRYEVSTSLPSTLPASAARAKPAPMTGGDFGDRDRLVEFALGAIRQANDRH